MTEKMIWVWLSLHFGAGSRLYQRLFAHFGSLEAIYDCDDADVAPIDFLTSSQKRAILDKNTNDASDIIEWCDYYGVGIVTPSDSDYPSPLRGLNDYPAVLYYRGRLPDFSKELCISVVGSREYSKEGSFNAYTLGYSLAKGGAIVVSGMAKGIDCIAQKGALFSGGSAIAVLGSGIDVCYPYENLELMEKIARVGTVITEYPPHSPAKPQNFPVRNRIISGLSVATVVVEARNNSGALITAEKAKKQGRDVFAFPGSVGNVFCAGNLKLLSEYARVATAAIDILEQYLDLYPECINLTASKEKPVRVNGKVVDNRPRDVGAENATSVAIPMNTNTPPISRSRQENTVDFEEKKFDPSVLGEKERAVYNSMQFGKPISLDEFAKMDYDVSVLTSIITMLEISGAIESIPGGFYIKK